MVKTYAKIIKNFLFEDEIQKLNNWTLDNCNNFYFQDAKMDPFHSGTRFSTRMENDVTFKDLEFIINYPKECYNIRERIQNFFNLHDFKSPPSFYNGIVNGIGFSPGIIENHIDPIYFEGTETLHCNIITQNSISGGITYINNQKYLVNPGDLLMYVVSKHYHYVTEIQGNLPRILWVFGFCIDNEKITQIFT
jgi:hypothetical protein